MTQCNHKGCGSYAFNLWREGIDQGDLCDVHYWQSKAELASTEAYDKCIKACDDLAAEYRHAHDPMSENVADECYARIKALAIAEVKKP